MELVDRYLQAVKFWLPRQQKDDIIAELSEELRSQIEEKESELSRPLDPLEVELILKRCGSPIAVAERYLPQRSLIGPALFPIYSAVIKTLFFYFLLPWFLLWLGIAIFSPDFQANHPGIAMAASLDPWWIAATHALFFNTLAFALLDRSQARSQLLNTWTVHSLPAERDPFRIPRGHTICEITVSVATLSLWLDVGGFHRVFHFFGLYVALSHAWPYFFWALMLLSVCGIGIAGLHLLNLRWTPLSAALRLGIDAYSFALIYWLCRARLLESLSGNDLPSSGGPALVASINHWLSASSLYVIVVGLAVLFFDIRRILRPMAVSKT